jgi:peptidoglycan/xylan/chitin deacetylase (PgdA/CDA1 family)
VERRDDRYYLEERYARPRSRRALNLFYRLKPLIPRRLQIGLRRARARRLLQRHAIEGRFPSWPIETALVERLEAEGHWPAGHRFAYVLTHDVERAGGLAGIEPLLALEAEHGMVSAWFLVGDDYPVEPALLDRLRAAGCEVALHGMHHDGRLFESRHRFERELPGIHRRLDEWGAEGFRSPGAHRNADWMPELRCSYDSSFHDTDPFDAQPGGCCSILPYFLEDLVELPITLPHDFTLFELLRAPDITLWREKAGWIAAHGGLVNVLVHPDYARTPERLQQYRELLEFLAGLPGGWHALPREVAAWWRRRSATGRALEDDGSTLISIDEEEHARS